MHPDLNAQNFHSNYWPTENDETEPTMVNFHCLEPPHFLSSTFPEIQASPKLEPITPKPTSVSEPQPPTSIFLESAIASSTSSDPNAISSEHSLGPNQFNLG